MARPQFAPRVQSIIQCNIELHLYCKLLSNAILNADTGAASRSLRQLIPSSDLHTVRKQVEWCNLMPICANAQAAPAWAVVVRMSASGIFPCRRLFGQAGNAGSRGLAVRRAQKKARCARSHWRLSAYRCQMTAETFLEDERDYLAWLAANPHGFVLNRFRKENSASYMVLHRATCRLISQLSGNARVGGFTERGYIKICASDVETLAGYARQHASQHGKPGGSFSKVCAFCDPTGVER
ncbi:hypothetical protein [Paraburkholderia elongata]|uniref:Uncharacterized protein n=1 Tax=Paraburkholderia elongata TaxID=2675747 RepID=A0A972SS96_9BURK|nr:hypothetical protein [Paraburkholderia elongata]NPT61650.1 hypothetical protein [Paraburkholderia elongata]